MKKIDFEAHFYNQAYLEVLHQNEGYPKLVMGGENQGRRLWYTPDIGQPFDDLLLDALLDTGEKRLKRMDACGIDVQVLSLSAPGLEQLPSEKGRRLAVDLNNTLSKIINRYPDRFAGYAALAPNDPEAAADELERAVNDLGFIGWNTHSNYGDTYLDNEKYLPIVERAERLAVPVYLHPTVPETPALGAYGFPLAGAPFGFAMDTAACMMRLIYSGVFDRFPGLKIILGHLGESLPFLLKRIDWAYVRPFDPTARPKLSRKPSEYLRSNVYITTSGNYYEPAFMCAREAMGVDRILFGTDFPYEEPEECVEFIAGLPITEVEKIKIYSLNARQLGVTV